MATVRAKGQFQFQGDDVFGWNGWVVFNGKRHAVPPKEIEIQETRNAEPYWERVAYDTKDELREAAKRLLRRLARAEMRKEGVQ